jgi:hypothetical protein
MHVSNLGIMQWTNGASLTALLDAGVYGDSNVMGLDARLKVCFDRFKGWCRANRIESSACSVLLSLLFYVGFTFSAFVNCCICPALLQSIPSVGAPSRCSATLLSVVVGRRTWS